MSGENTDRRNFIKASAGAAAALTVAGNVKTLSADKSNTPETGVERENKVEVHHEWGTLKEVVCGIPFFRIPNELPKAIYNYTPTEGIKFFESNPGKTFEEADPATFRKARDQMEAAAEIRGTASSGRIGASSGVSAPCRTTTNSEARAMASAVSASGGLR